MERRKVSRSYNYLDVRIVLRLACLLALVLGTTVTEAINVGDGATGYSVTTHASDPLDGTYFMTKFDGWGFTKDTTTWYTGGMIIGNYFWLVPRKGNNLKVVKVHKTTGVMNRYNPPSSIGPLTRIHMYETCVYDGSNLWLLPYNGEKVVKVNPSTGGMTPYGSFPSGVTPTANGKLYLGATYTNGYIWATPSGSISNKVTRIRTSNGAMNGYSNWPSGFSLVVGSVNLIGACFDGTRHWMAPAKIKWVVGVSTGNPSSGLMKGWNGAGWGGGLVWAVSYNFGGAVSTAANIIHLIPNHANAIVKLNTLTGAKTIYLTGSMGGDAIFDGKYLWCTPSGKVVRFDTTNGNTLDITNWPTGMTGNFRGLSYDPSTRSLWFVPQSANMVIKFSVTPCSTSTDCNNHANSATGYPATGCTCSCRASWSGPTCNLCAAKYDNTNDCSSCASGYETYDNCYRICTSAADCNGHADSVSGNAGPAGCTCTCQTGFAGPTCGSCAKGFARYPSGCETETLTLTVTPPATPSTTTSLSGSQTVTASESPSESTTLSGSVSTSQTDPSPSQSRSLTQSQSQSLTGGSPSSSSSFSQSVTVSSSPSESPSVSSTVSRSVSSSGSTSSSQSPSGTKTECTVFGPPRERSLDFLNQEVAVLSLTGGRELQPGPLVAQVTSGNTSNNIVTRSNSIPTLTGAEFTNRRFQFLDVLTLSVQFNQPLRRDVSISDLVFAQEAVGTSAVSGFWDASPGARNYSLQDVSIVDILPLSDDPFHTIQLSVPFTTPSTWWGDPRVISVFVHRSAFRCEEFWIPGDQLMGFNMSVVVQHDPYAPFIDPAVQSVAEKIAIVTNTISAGLGHPATAFIITRVSTLNSLALCYFSHNHSLSSMTSPLDQKFGSEFGQYYRGGIVGNLCLFVGLALVSTGCTLFIFLRAILKTTPGEETTTTVGGDHSERKRSYAEHWNKALATMHMPSVLIVPICLCFQGTVSICTTLFVHTDDAMDVGLAVVGGIVCFLILLGVALSSTKFFGLRLEKRKQQQEPEKAGAGSAALLVPLLEAREESRENDALNGENQSTTSNNDAKKDASRWQRFCSILDSYYHWVNTDERRPHWKAQFYLFFHDYSYAFFFLVEIGVCFFAGIIDGVRITDWTTCVSLVALMAILFLAMVVGVAVVKPSLTQFQQGFLLVMNALSFIASVLLLIGMVASSPGCAQAAALIGFVMLIFGTLKFIMDMYAAAMWAWRKLSKRLFPLDKNSNTQLGLSAALLSEHQASIVMESHDAAAASNSRQLGDDDVSLELPEFDYVPGEAVEAEDLDLEVPDFEYHPTRAATFDREEKVAEEEKEEVEQDERERESEATWWARQQRIREAREAEVELERRRPASSEIGLARLSRSHCGAAGRENAFATHIISKEEQAELDALLNSLDPSLTKMQQHQQVREVTQADLDRLDAVLGNSSAPPAVPSAPETISAGPQEEEEEAEATLQDSEVANEGEEEEDDEDPFVDQRTEKNLDEGDMEAAATSGGLEGEITEEIPHVVDQLVSGAPTQLEPPSGWECDEEAPRCEEEEEEEELDQQLLDHDF